MAPARVTPSPSAKASSSPSERDRQADDQRGPRRRQEARSSPAASTMPATTPSGAAGDPQRQRPGAARGRAPVATSCPPRAAARTPASAPPPSSPACFRPGTRPPPWPPARTGRPRCRSWPARSPAAPAASAAVSTHERLVQASGDLRERVRAAVLAEVEVDVADRRPAPGTTRRGSTATTTSTSPRSSAANPVSAIRPMMRSGGMPSRRPSSRSSSPSSSPLRAAHEAATSASVGLSVESGTPAMRRGSRTLASMSGSIPMTSRVKTCSSSPGAVWTMQPALGDRLPRP